MKKVEISIILPCRNEEKALESVLAQAKKILSKNRINGEIIVSDSSSDGSPEIAKKCGVRLIKHDKDGYGNAILEGFKIARGKYLFIADADGSYDLNEIPKFLKSLREGNDFVIGNRFKGKIEKGAMPFSHEHIGNPLLSGILRLFFRSKVRDVHCGMRAISKEALKKLNLYTTGMEFASEMVVQAAKNKLKIKEIPINYHSRKGDSKLRTMADGWRHIRFMFLYSPMFLFFIPGIMLFLLGFVSMLMLYFGGLTLLGVRLYFHPMFLSAAFLIIGYQLMIFAVFAKTYAITHLGEESKMMNRLHKLVSIEKASIFGSIVIVVGAIIYLNIFLGWMKSGFGSLNEVKNSIVALTFVVLGVQTIFSSFMLSILGIRGR